MMSLPSGRTGPGHSALLAAEKARADKEQAARLAAEQRTEETFAVQSARADKLARQLKEAREECDDWRKLHDATQRACAERNVALNGATRDLERAEAALATAQADAAAMREACIVQVKALLKDAEKEERETYQHPNSMFFQGRRNGISSVLNLLALPLPTAAKPEAGT